jgi:hypothetical protein
MIRGRREKSIEDKEYGREGDKVVNSVQQLHQKTIKMHSR